MYTPWAYPNGETIKPKKNRKSVPPETKIGFTRIKSVVDNVIENMCLCVDPYPLKITYIKEMLLGMKNTYPIYVYIYKKPFIIFAIVHVSPVSYLLPVLMSPPHLSLHDGQKAPS
jgi:hypothetical protein